MIATARSSAGVSSSRQDRRASRAASAVSSATDIFVPAAVGAGRAALSSRIETSTYDSESPPSEAKRVVGRSRRAAEQLGVEGADVARARRAVTVAATARPRVAAARRSRSSRWRSAGSSATTWQAPRRLFGRPVALEQRRARGVAARPAGRTRAGGRRGPPARATDALPSARTARPGRGRSGGRTASRTGCVGRPPRTGRRRAARARSPVRSSWTVAAAGPGRRALRRSRASRSVRSRRARRPRRPASISKRTAGDRARRWSPARAAASSGGQVGHPRGGLGLAVHHEQVEAPHARPSSASARTRSGASRPPAWVT